MNKMKLISEVKIDENFPKIDYSTQLYLLGSCFSENIYKRLIHSKFSAFSNPFGISFNPVSLHQQISFLCNANSIELKIRSEHAYHFSYLFSRLYCLPFDSAAELKKAVMKTKTEASQNFDQSEFLFITYGTSWVYEINESEVVNNCHKQPSKLFNKRLLSVSEIVESFKTIVPFLNNKKVIFTLSPVRHQKDGFHNNQLSKATLLLAIEEISKLSNNYYYFPSYEIVLDELRDYRFFSKDLLHPNELAIDYLWEKLRTAFFSLTTIEIEKEVIAIQNSLNHRSMKQNSKENIIFKEKLDKKIDELRKASKINFNFH